MSESSVEPRVYFPEAEGVQTEPADHTVLVRIRKEGDHYVAYPKRIPVLQGVANIVFVLENAPPDAQLLKIRLKEEKPPATSDPEGPSNPFKFPPARRVMLLTDNNRERESQGRSFEYILKVKEGDQEIDVDPGIDNDPPPPY